MNTQATRFTLSLRSLIHTLLLAVLLSGSAQVHAVYVPDPATVEGPGLPNDDLFPGGDLPAHCSTCCKDANGNAGHESLCGSMLNGCVCNELPASCSSKVAMSHAGVSQQEANVLSDDFMLLWERMAAIKGAEELTRIYQDHEIDLGLLAILHKELAQEITAFMRKNQATFSNIASGKGKVSTRELRSLKRLLNSIIASDKKYQGEQSELANKIEKRVLPRLTNSMVGMPYHKALSCFVAYKCAK